MDINSTLLNDPLIGSIRGLVNTLSIVIGGVFGFYVISIIWSIYSSRKNLKTLKSLQKSVHHMQAAIEGLEAEIKGLKRGMHQPKTEEGMKKGSI